VRLRRHIDNLLSIRAPQAASEPQDGADAGSIWSPGEAVSHFARSAEPGDPEAVIALVRALHHTWSQYANAEAFVLVDRYR
jgi:hypothetical protein